MLKLIAIKLKCATCRRQSGAWGKEPRELKNQHKMGPLGGGGKKKHQNKQSISIAFPRATETNPGTHRRIII